jgi:site-specific recombinase XerD
MGSALAGRAVNAVLRKVPERAGLTGQGITPHKLRHTFATFTRLWRASLLRTVRDLLSRSDLETTAKYLHSDTPTKQAAVLKLSGLLGSSPPRHLNRERHF